MTLELFKAIVQPVAVERDENGDIMGERVGDPVSLYTDEQVLLFLQQVREELASQQNGAAP